MSGSSPNISLDSFDFAKYYDGLTLQMGVPVMDSDWNEQNDIRRIHEIVQNMATIGSIKLSTAVYSSCGFDLLESVSDTTNNFKIYGGWAMVEGVLVPTTIGTPPADIDYIDQIMFTGKVSAIGGGSTYIEDTSKNYLASHSLVGCRLIPTSGTDNGIVFMISVLTSSTRLTLSGGVGNILADDTYEIRPPLLTTPGTDRVDYAYIQVWFDDINDVEDPNIVNPGVLIETCHRVKRSWCVRVAEGTTVPTNSNSDIYGFGPRYLRLATMYRNTGESEIITSIIINVAGKANLATFYASSVWFNPSNLVSHGYAAVTDTTVQLALDGVSHALVSQAVTGGTHIVGSSAITGTVDSLAVGTTFAQLSSLLGLTNSRVRVPNQNTAAMLLSSGPQLVWRSHNITGDANVTKDTVSWYVANHSTLGGGCIIIITGGYLSGVSCYRAPFGTAPTFVSMNLFSNGTLYYFYKSSVATPWNWATVSAWDNYGGFYRDDFYLSNVDLVVSDMEVTMATSAVNLTDKDSYIKSTNVAYPRRISSMDLSTAPGTTSYPGIWCTSNATYITQNCYWNTAVSPNKWKAYNTSLSATAIAVTTSGVTIFRKSPDDSISSGWEENTVGIGVGKWTASILLGEAVTASTPDRYYGLGTSGGCSEVIPYYGLCFANQVVSASYFVTVPISFRYRRGTAPTVTVYSESHASIPDTGVYIPHPTVPEWGGYLRFTTETIADETLAYQQGYIIVMD